MNKSVFNLFPRFQSEDGTLTIFSRIPASQQFIGAIMDGASPVLLCQLCERSLYNSSGEYMVEGELEKLEKKQGENPKKFIPIDNQIYCGTIEGKQVLVDCPCNGLRLFEDFIWNNSLRISRYLYERSKIEFEAAQTEVVSADKLKQVINP